MRYLTALLLSLFSVLTIQAQPPTRYSATTGDVSLSGAGTALTIQQPASEARQVQFESATVYCSVACTITQSQNGTPATATAGTVVAISPGTSPPRATAWTASNAGSGTSVGPALHLTAAGTVVIDLSKVSMGNNGSSANYTVTISSITGTANITYVWGER